MTGSSKEDSKFEQVVHKIDPQSKLLRTALVCDDASFPRTLGSATCAEICKLVRMGDASVPTPHNPSPAPTGTKSLPRRCHIIFTLAREVPWTPFLEVH